ncbi:MAG: 3-methyladenine DNA glycosylase AlkD [Halioglobus sp.]|jgi:3-methyladenine DNA glycosylase AlkD
MNTKIRQILVETDRLLHDASVESDRISMKGYMKNHFDFYGVKSPARKDVLKEVKCHLKEFDREEIFTFAEELWNNPKRESQYFALDFFYYKKNFWNESYLSRVEKLITTKSWWDAVDGLAPNIAGFIFSKEKSVRHQWIEEWNNSDNIWLNRSALIHQLRYKSDVDLDLLFALVETHIGSKEFFINKAAGWALRQASKFHPCRIKDFIDDHPKLSNLTKREGSKYL